jgi:RNA polymerase sigma-70 factor (ECF subfamily)
MRETSAGGEALPARGTGDPHEFVATAYDAHAGGLYRYAVMLLADPAGAEDAVQQAFMKLARMGRRAEAIESCAGYLRTAVRNECWRLIQKRRRWPRVVGIAAARPLIEPMHGGDVDAEERAQVEAALRRLPPEQREVIHMKLYEGHTFQQIADWLGISINTVASRYRYALDKLRVSLSEACGADGGSREPG